MITAMEMLLVLQTGYDCAFHCYDTRPPTAAYAERVALQLYGTAVVESGGFRWDRQQNLSLIRKIGGWSWYQLQWGSVYDSLQMLKARPELAKNCAAWVWERSDADPDIFRRMEKLPLFTMNLIRVDWRLATMFARLHYYRVTPKPIPATVNAQALYWKRYYNTELGAGTVEHYVDLWRRIANGIVETWSPVLTI